MSTPKGYFSQDKDDRVKPEHVTLSQAGQFKHALDVRDTGTVSVVASDAVEASSTTSVINATAHAAKAGDRIRFTSGTHNRVEVDVLSVTANTITLAQTLSSAPALGVTFDILTQTSLTVGADGTISASSSSGPIQFVLDGVDTEVEEDTVTPANNRPLPVKLTGFTGDVAINASNLNLEVQLSHLGANADSVKIGDGTDLLSVNADGSLNVTDNGGSLTVDNSNLDVALSTRASEATLASVETAAQEIAETVYSDSDVTDKGLLVGGHDSNDFHALKVDLDGKLFVKTTAADFEGTVIVTDGTDTIDINADGSVNVTDNGGSLTIDSTALDDIANDIGIITPLINDSTYSVGAPLTKGFGIGGSEGGDFEFLQLDGSSNLLVSDPQAQAFLSTISNNVANSLYAEDAASIGSELLSLAGFIRQDTPATTTSLDGDYSNGKVDSLGRLWVNASGAAVPVTDNAGSLTVDAVNLDIRDLTHVGGQDSVRIGDGTDFAEINAGGELLVNDGDANTTLTSIDNNIDAIEGYFFQEDDPSAGTEHMILAGLVRQDTPVTTTSLDGDYTYGKTDSASRLWVVDKNSDASLTSLQLIDDTVNTDGSAIGTKGLTIGGTTGTDFALIKVSAAGEIIEANSSDILTSVELIDDAVNTDGSAIGTKGLAIGGTDGTNFQHLSVTSLGALNVVQAAQDVVDLTDSPFVDFSSSNLPGSASSTLEVVASLAAAVKKVHAISTSGAFIGLYVGAGNGTLKLVIPPGNDSAIIDASIAASSRISIRRVDSASAETTGGFSINFIG